jgi:hypothetical protein
MLSLLLGWRYLVLEEWMSFPFFYNLIYEHRNLGGRQGYIS